MAGPALPEGLVESTPVVPITDGRPSDQSTPTNRYPASRPPPIASRQSGLVMSSFATPNPNMSFSPHAFGQESGPPAPKGLLARRRMTVMAQRDGMSPGAGPGDTPWKSFRGANPTFKVSDMVDEEDEPLALPTLGASSPQPADLPLPALSSPSALQPANERPSPADSNQEITRSFISKGKSFNGNAKSFASRRMASGKAGVQSQAQAQGQGQGHWSLLAHLPEWKHAILRAMNHRWYYAFLCVTTLYILFEDDVKRACLPPSFDLPLETIIAFVLMTILIEMGLSCFIKSGYLLGFYFWVDCIVCASLFFEVPAVKRTVLGFNEEAVALDYKDSFIAWAGNRAFISSKVARVARIFRLLRLLRLYSVYKRFEARRRIRAALEKAGIRPGDGDERIAEEEMSMIELEILQDQDKETRVGQKLEELIIRRIIIFVLVCVLILPAFEADYGLWGKVKGVDRGGLVVLHDTAVAWGGALPPNTTTSDLSILPPSPFLTALFAFLNEVVYHIGSHSTSEVLELTVANATYISYPPGASRRYDEIYYMDIYSYNTTDPACSATAASTNGCSTWHTYALYDLKWFSQVAAILSISRSLFVITFLTLGAYLLNRDSRVLVLEPIERMLARVSALAENPLALQPAAHAPWQEQLEKMQQAQEREAALQAQKEAEAALEADGLVRKKSLTDMFFNTARRSLLGKPADGSGEVQAVIHVGGGDGAEPSAPSARTLAVTPPAWGDASNRALVARVSGVSVGAPAESGQGAAAWRTVGNTVTAAVRLQSAVQETRWQQVKAKTKVFLRRLATNFWDGTEEEQPVAKARGEKEPGSDKETTASYETQLLENSIQKIGALLAVGFGDAGAEIIAENIRNEGDINPMVPGKKTVGIFGFCDIRRFTDATEVLQEEVMEFVNSIARIVHTSVAIHGGAANKNIGDAFLLVWKLPKGFTMADLRDACNHNTSQAPSQPVTAAPPLALPAPSDLSSGTFTISARPVAEGDEDANPSGSAQNDALLSLPFLSPGDQSWPKLALPSVSQDQASSPFEPSTADHKQQTVPLPSVPSVSSGDAQAGSMHSPHKTRFLSIVQQDNRVVPLPSTDSLPAAGASSAAVTKPRQFSRGAGMTFTPSLAMDGKKDGNDLESEAVRRMMRMRSKGGDVDPSQGISIPEKGALVAAVADNALMSFIIIHAALKRSVRLARYQRRADLMARLGPNFRVAMGFGLHVGWAIEGAIGSEYKIDASYLSPNVNMASRLEAATKQFGVTLLMSEDFADCLSADVRARVRQIDCVTVKGSVKPMGLFTYDIDLDGIAEPNPDMPGAEEQEEAFWADYACGLCATDDVTATWGVTPEFLSAFDTGFQAYKSGDWPRARELLQAASDMRHNLLGDPLPDPPARVLLTHMEQYNFQAPPTWKGYRELTEK